jgi:hypothetical protein
VIISDTHRYLFVEQPHTACTAIRDELVELYGGRPILSKHATYAAFLRVATPEQRHYFVFSGIRDPLDEAVSLYFKYRTDHQGTYSRRLSVLADRQREAFESVANEQIDFADYLRRFYRRPYDNDTIVYHGHMDHIIRFESVQEDFGVALQRLGLEQLRPLPAVNQTARSGSYLERYPPDLWPYAAKIFGPFMRKWGYALPSAWAGVTVPRSATIQFRLLSPVRYLYRRYIRLGALDVDRRPSSRLGRAMAVAVRPVSRAMHRLFGH